MDVSPEIFRIKGKGHRNWEEFEISGNDTEKHYLKKNFEFRFEMK